jgi:hypothetical protein
MISWRVYLEKNKPIRKKRDEEEKDYSQTFNVLYSSIMMAAPITNLGIVEP